MGLIFLIIVIIVVIKLIKLLQRGNSQPSNYSEDYRQGYWDGVRDAQNGCAKIENDNGQVRLITENQSAASRLANTPLNISKNENLDNIIPTSISTSEERVNTVTVPVENNIERTSHIDDKEKERGRKTTINIALYTASLLLTAGILLLAQAINLSIQLRFGLVWLFIFYLLYYWSDTVCSLADIEICVDGTYWYGLGSCTDWRLDYEFAFRY